ncbi:hypothetical protein [Mongoliitalea daihaiensis]|uniref:hypothetical protein n=1 Tax=Mongoliitalea daihaiensis TaxID=2782006 RepID=UPI001F2C34EC|nr:hypothetical protein [Mongoliitalea daihaiensis]UJP64898.1 hypothetical protein IPZ59_19245 [Mongoliitalea daihaiensis]
MNKVVKSLGSSFDESELVIIERQALLENIILRKTTLPFCWQFGFYRKFKKIGKRNQVGSSISEFHKRSINIVASLAFEERNVL